MHIVIANNIYPPHVAGGAELIVSYLAQEVARRGHEVTVVSTCGPEMEPYPDQLSDGVKVIRFFPTNLYWTFDRRPRPVWKKALWHMRDAWNPSASHKLRQIFDSSPPQILHTHVIDGFSGSIWRLAKQRGIGVIHTAHDYHLICPRAFMMTADWKLCTAPSFKCRAFARWHINTTRYIDVFTGPSRFLLEKHIAAGLKAKITDVVSNGIPLPRVEPNGTPKSSGRPTLRLLFAARLTVEKGVRIALEAMKQVPAEAGVTLEVAGRGPLADEVKSAAEKDCRVRFHGYISGDLKHQLFRDSDCLLLPSLWYENAPVVIIEAGAYGLGVLASDIGAIPEFVVAGSNGLLFRPGDAVGLAKLIARVSANRELLQTFKESGEAMSRRFSVGQMADRYLAHYVQTIQQRTTRHPHTRANGSAAGAA